jgi:acetyl-CoA C-acetyltransferase
MDSRDAIIVSGVRTPIGSYGGALRSALQFNLASTVMKEVCGRINFPKELFDDIHWGIVMPRTDEQGVARDAAISVGIPDHVPAMQVNRACCSSMEAVRIAYLSIRLGEADAILAGGAESMSNAAYSIKNLRWGKKLGHQQLSDGVWDVLTDHHLGQLMGMTAENVAEKHGITRRDQDEYAYTSQMRARRALETGRFKDEIAPVVIPGGRGRKDIIVDTDEYPRPETTLEELAGLPSAFKKDGSVTAGNSSGINDGASAVIVVSGDLAKRLNAARKWRIVGAVAVGVDPRYMGEGPIYAIPRLLKKTGRELKDIQLFEINEAFAAPSVAVERALGLDREIVNVNGGAIALGHPIGDTGCRILVSLIHEMEKRGLRLGIAALCGGGGIGEAVLVERAE